MILEAEGERRSDVERAQGDKQSDIIEEITRGAGL